MSSSKFINQETKMYYLVNVNHNSMTAHLTGIDCESFKDVIGPICKGQEDGSDSCPETSARNYLFPEECRSLLLHSRSLKSHAESDLLFHLLSEIYSKIFPLADMFYLGHHIRYVTLHHLALSLVQHRGRGLVWIGRLSGSLRRRICGISKAQKIITQNTALRSKQ